MMQQDWQLRQDCLYKELFQSPIICFFCQLSEEILRCDILMDQTPCQKHICANCFKKMKEKNCQCGRKYQEHYFKDKIKRALKYGLIDKANMHFNRQHKIRKNPLFQSIDYDYVNLLAYLHLNPTPARITFFKVEENLRSALSEKKKEERILSKQRSGRKKAVYIRRANANVDQTGLDSCGYDRTYGKGINLVLNSFFSSSKDKSF